MTARSSRYHSAAALVLLALAGCGEGDKPAQAKAPPLVRAATPTTRHFVDVVEAVGTARANEQVTLSSPVTERIERISFTDGGYVRAGQVIAVLAQAQERAALAGAVAAERQATAQLGRLNALTSRGFVTPATVEQQSALAQRARADADTARAQITDRVVRAPFSGFASQRLISQGTIISAGTPIATISDIARIKLDFSVPETAMASLRIGERVTARSAAYPDVPFVGLVSSIDPVIDPTTRAASIRAILPNPGNRLKPGMLLTVSLVTGERDAPAVPELAVLGDGAERYVYVIDREGVARRTKVTTGARDGGYIELRGITPNARVVTEGVVKIDDGVKVKVEGDKDKPAKSASKPGITRQSGT
ncbi:efflux RND transporter periplasmic adaptor subunit [Sphingomonas radiodurans]|uniref:efflux RND transporter periplasmic adaptor subunit n=1 Tax=Sphingomonas radiodurans TaxID=2890321 RepID=UPI001E2A18EA|nr:efflux RND transporter periplasmic adaptor subunit [Sphingomonas radiodurans]WBH18277.1 efflux RND transporter periplasmic adaptor subunit [Sphingomonas radiodurans]